MIILITGKFKFMNNVTPHSFLLPFFFNTFRVWNESVLKNVQQILWLKLLPKLSNPFFFIILEVSIQN